MSQCIAKMAQDTDDVTTLLSALFITCSIWFKVSVTRLGDLLDFGQLFKAFGNNQFTQISHILRQFLYRCQNLSLF